MLGMPEGPPLGEKLLLGVRLGGILGDRLGSEDGSALGVTLLLGTWLGNPFGP